MVPGAMFSTVTSAFVKSSLTSSSPRGVLRLIVIDRLLALNMWKYQGSSSGLPGRSRRPGSPVFGFSILTTSAPSHASASVHDVPASNCVKSTIRMPARQLRSWALSLIAGLPPVEGAPDGNSAPDALEHLDRVVRELERWHRDGARLQLVAGGTIAHHLVQGLRHQMRVVRLVAERVHELVGRDDLGHAGAGIADSLGRIDGQLDRQADVRPEQLARSVGLGAGLAVHGRPRDGGIGPDADERARAVQREADRDALAPEERVEIAHRLPARRGPVRADAAVELDGDGSHGRPPQLRCSRVFSERASVNASPLPVSRDGLRSTRRSAGAARWARSARRRSPRRYARARAPRAPGASRSLAARPATDLAARRARATPCGCYCARRRSASGSPGRCRRTAGAR